MGFAILLWTLFFSAWTKEALAEEAALATPATQTSKPVLSWETGVGKSYLIPALEIPGFILFLNGYDRLAHGNDREGGKKVYSTTPSTFWKNAVHGRWGGDRDSFKMNQFMHPYQGSVYYGFARSAGLNYWESLGYTFVGSFLWETAGETTSPSINDQVASGIAGTFLGEPLFRMAGLVLEGGGSEPGFWRELGAAVISPPTGFNRLVFGDRFKTVFPNHDPAIFWNLRLGVSENISVNNSGGSSTNTRKELTAGYSMDYGLPGKTGYTYERPFDYFHIEFNAVNNAHDNPFETIILRGLLLGKKYEVGSAYRGVWGLYGLYHYISPRIFRISTTTLSLGTTAQWWLSRSVALQGTALGGIGYGAAGTIRPKGNRDYYYSTIPQGILDLRLILGDRAMLDLAGREYYVTGGTGSRWENIFRGNVGLTVRIYGQHALGIQYIQTNRDAHYSNLPDKHPRVGTIRLVYTLLGDTNFGAVEWRDINANNR